MKTAVAREKQNGQRFVPAPVWKHRRKPPYFQSRRRTSTVSPSILTSWAVVGSVAGMVSASPVRMSKRAPCRGQMMW